MSTASFLQRCIDAGADPALAVKMAAVFEEEMTAALGDAAQKLAKRRQDDADRQRRRRASRDTTAKTSRDRVESRDVVESASRDRPRHVTPSPKETTGSLFPTTELDQTPNPPPVSPPPLSRRAFDEFWLAYPNKVGKRAAEQAFDKARRRINGGRDPLATMLAGLERAKTSDQWLRGFVPHPATWLNQDRWLDEPAENNRFNGAHNDPAVQRHANRHENYRRAVFTPARRPREDL